MKLRTLGAAPLAVAYWLGVAGARLRANGRARILMLHGTPRWSARSLERALRYVRNQFHVVPLQALAGAACAGNARFDRHVAITFDDGLRNNVEVAYPILRALGMPASFFVCPALIDEKRWLWNHEARRRLFRLAPAARSALARELGCAEDVESTVSRMKELTLAERHVVEALLCAETPGFKPTAEEHHQFDLANWHELRSLDPAIVTIGSHTLFHPILTELTRAELEYEVVESRRALEAKLDRPIETFAYPNGDLNAQVLECVRSTYRAAVTVEEGQVAPGCDPHLLPRISYPGDVLRLALVIHRDHLRVTPSSASGSHVAMEGNAMTTTRASTIMQKKGIEARAT